MTALSFVWVHPYSQKGGCDIIFRWSLGSAVSGQVGESILHVLIVYIEETFLFSLGMKELMGKDAD